MVPVEICNLDKITEGGVMCHNTIKSPVKNNENDYNIDQSVIKNESLESDQINKSDTDMLPSAEPRRKRTKGSSTNTTL